MGVSQVKPCIKYSVTVFNLFYKFTILSCNLMIYERKRDLVLLALTTNPFFGLNLHCAESFPFIIPERLSE